ncbi:MAG: MFS transporter [Nitrososphaerales archaeon]
MASQPPADSPRNLAVLLFARTSLNLQYRIVYPFLPVISRGLGVPLEVASLLLTVRSFFGVLSPLYGVAADRYGRRPLMLAGLLALSAGAVIAALSPGIGIALIAFALLGFSKAAFDPAMQAYVGDAVPYARRGRVLSLLELSWSASWFIGVPLAGFVIAGFTWRAPFVLIALAGGLSVLALGTLCPGCGQSATLATGASLLEGFRKVPWRRALPVLAFSVLLTLGNENVFIVYGAWLEQQFGLAVTAIGIASLVISVAELTAEFASAGLVDRVGKRRSVLLGTFLSVAAYLVLLPLARGLGGGLAGIALMFLTFEFSIVASIPLISEVAPATRGTLLALNVSAAALGRMLGSLTGPRLWSAYGLSGVALASAGFALMAALILWSRREEQLIAS